MCLAQRCLLEWLLAGQGALTTYLGIDLGTSAVKALLVDEGQTVLASAEAGLATAHRHPLWSEQDPDEWWRVVEEVVARIRSAAPAMFAQIRGIGLSGQMHGAVLLDRSDLPLRPAILWNDGRSFREADMLRTARPDLSRAVGVQPMPGLTAPKLLWLARYEEELFAAIRTVLLPKDYIRMKLVGDRITDMSDAAGTWWLDEEARTWSPAALEATGVTLAQMPHLVESARPSGTLRPALARQWGLSAPIVVAGGAGDAAAGAIGLGAATDGDAFVSLGTSGQLFVTTDAFRPAPETLVHAFCHALPGRWFQMAAMLNGASCLAWVAGLVGTEIASLLNEVEQAYAQPADVLFLPYLNGERTPHNDPHARGVFFGLSPTTTRATLAQAVLEGVAFSFADAKECLAHAGTCLSAAGMVGGGARNRLWAQLLANVMDIALTRYAGADKGPAFGATRLARLAVTREEPALVCTPPPVLDVVMPDAHLAEAYRTRTAAFRRLYAALKAEFAAAASARD
jgi:xylulokinase